MLIQAAGLLPKILAKNQKNLETRKSSKSRQLDSGPKFWLQVQLPGFEIQAAGFAATVLAANPVAWICGVFGFREFLRFFAFCRLMIL